MKEFGGKPGTTETKLLLKSNSDKLERLLISVGKEVNWLLYKDKETKLTRFPIEFGKETISLSPKNR